MKNPKHLLGIAVFSSILFLTGCEEKLDTSSPEIFEASIKQVSAEMKPVDKVKFENSLKTVLNYNYALYHDGATLDESMGLLVAQRLSQFAGNQDIDLKKANDKTDQAVADMLSGKTASDVIAMEPDLKEKIADMKKQRQDKINESMALEQKKILEQQKVQRIAFLNKSIAINQAEIAQIDSDVQVAIPKLESLEAERTPYAYAQQANSNGSFTTINHSIKTIEGHNPNERIVSFDFVNNSQLSVNKIAFNMEYYTNGNRIARNSQEVNFESPIEPKGTYHFEFSYNKPGLTLSRYNPSDVELKVSFTSIQNTEKGINVSSDIYQTGWKNENEYQSLKKLVETAESQKAMRNANIETYRQELSNLH